MCVVYLSVTRVEIPDKPETIYALRTGERDAGVRVYRPRDNLARATGGVIPAIAVGHGGGNCRCPCRCQAGRGAAWWAFRVALSVKATVVDLVVCIATVEEAPVMGEA